ncbi:hypothetical protein NUW58_g2126 [Xylaria curta]|uniref:Uncharacterized protein n=1 Tax=Xylaria curta TaxID=42375 RepID=A0ACC1PKB3_9PEZI|nr:hypothetical protein NUW58_g2126 [Xylaria curta]
MVKTSALLRSRKRRPELEDDIVLGFDDWVHARPLPPEGVPGSRQNYASAFLSEKADDNIARILDPSAVDGLATVRLRYWHTPACILMCILGGATPRSGYKIAYPTLA